MATTSPNFAPEIHRRLDAFGSYHLHVPALLGRWLGAPAEIEWDPPLGFEGELRPATAALWFSWRHRDDELLRSLEALEVFRAGFGRYAQDLQRYLVESFRRYVEPHLSGAERSSMADAGGRITDAAVVRDVRSLHLRFYATSKTVLRTAWLDVPWDEEHGLEVEWDAAGKLIGS